MKISDPFCRVQRRDEGTLVQLHESLVASDAADRPSLQRIRRRGLRLAANMAALIAVTTAVAAWLFPTSRVIVYLLAALCWIWIAAGYLKSRALLRRYENEYLGGTLTLADTDRQPPPTTTTSRPKDDRHDP